MDERFNNMWNIVFESLENDYPDIIDAIVDWYPSGYQEITVKDRNGVKRTYNWITGNLRVTYDPSYTCTVSEEEWRKVFSDRLHNRLITLGMSQETLSEITGISQVTLSKYFNGKATPSTYNSKKLAEALKCPIGELVEVR